MSDSDTPRLPMVFYSTTPPSPNGLLEGDIWVNTDGPSHRLPAAPTYTQTTAQADIYSAAQEFFVAYATSLNPTMRAFRHEMQDWLATIALSVPSVRRAQLAYARLCAHAYHQRIRQPQIDKQRRLIEQYGSAYRAHKHS